MLQKKLHWTRIVYLSKVPYTALKLYTFRPLATNFIYDVWQKSWGDPVNKDNKRRSVKPNLEKWLQARINSRQEVIVFARLRSKYFNV